MLFFTLFNAMHGYSLLIFKMTHVGQCAICDEHYELQVPWRSRGSPSPSCLTSLTSRGCPAARPTQPSPTTTQTAVKLQSINEIGCVDFD